ncbi:diguanylate cyclase domain-containing protein [Celeribacter sp.]|uniref:diguanylate cyclase domain-containing protein n=1 Tax=Celeribacter sp. TaxID=1890673 RepID=UPI003A94DDBC
MPGRILIADSVPTSRITMKVMLNAACYDVFMASSAEDVLITAATKRPDLIIVDTDLGDIGATGVCNHLKSDSTLKHIPIAVVGPDDNEHRLAALRAGAEVYFAKPIDCTELRTRVRALLRVAATADELTRREQTAREMGFGTTQAPFEPQSRVMLAANKADDAVKLRGALRGLIHADIEVVRREMLLHTMRTTPGADVIVISSDFEGSNEEMRLLSDIRARSETRHAAIVVMHPADKKSEALVALDLGANDIMAQGRDPEELALRLRSLIHRKREADCLRDTIDRGIKMASIDPLTGLYNRRYALPHLERLAADAIRTNTPFAVMIVDIDKFKSVNDTFGHMTGDTVLVEVARRLRDKLRPQDLVARIGGEEFLIALPASTLESARVAAERIRREVCATPAATSDKGQPVTVSISIGLAMCTDMPHCGASVSSLIDIADMALYTSKTGGRNQVTLGQTAA